MFRSGNGLFRWLRAILLAVTVTAGGHAGAQAQPLRPKAVAAVRPVSSTAPGGSSVLIETSPPIANLFARAEEGIERGDWKLAIDSLQRIIEDPDGSLLPREEGECDGGLLYESARRRALHRVAAFPADGLAAYRLVYDGKAKGLYERAATAHDVDALRSVVHRYLLTRWGDDAADVLASWALDDHRPGEALSVLRDVLELVPDADVPRIKLQAKLAVGEALTGRPDEALRAVDNLTGSEGSSGASLAWLQSIPALTESSTSDGTGDELTSWSLVTASGRRMILPPTTPTLVDPVPWKFDVSRQTSYTWQRITDDDSDRPSIVPANEIVLDGDRVFARVPGGVVALATEDLGVVWESTFRGFVSSVRAAASDFGDEELEVRQTAQTLEDYAAGALSVGHGLVLTVEREGRARAPDTGQPGVPRPQAGVTIADGTATRVVARDVRNGARRWHRGRTFDSSDPLGRVEFRGAPVAVGAELWVPMVSNNDLFLVALNPSDGAELHRLLLCSFPEGTRGDRPALPITAADGVIYVPSAFGAVFAVDASTRSLRWAHRYGAGPMASLDASGARVIQATFVPGGEGGDRSTWLSAPPVVAGGVVILAPVHGNELLAFAATDGSFRWSVSCPGGTYVLAADLERVWVGGRRLTCLSLQNGKVIWSTEVPETPTGRAAVCGDRILVPTAGSLFTFDSEDGHTLGRSTIPSQQMPLGNLVCNGAALFSYEPSAIRKYPDLERAYAAGMRLRQADPRNVDTALRLAWIELFRGNAAGARTLLSEIPETAVAADSRRSAAISHLRVETLLALGASSALSDSDAMPLLEEALGAASGAADRWRVTTRIAERRRAKGEVLAAYQILRNSSFSPDADRIVQSDTNVLTKARLDLGRRMRAIESELTEGQLLQLSRSARDQFEELVQSRERDGFAVARRAFLAFAELSAPKSLGAEALLELAAMELRETNTERSERLLEDCYHLNGSEDTAFESLVRLVAGRALRRDAILNPALVRELERRYGSRELPPDLRVLVMPEGEPASRVTVSDFIRHRRATFSAETQSSSLRGVESGGGVPDEIIQPTWAVVPASRRSPEMREPFPMSGDLKRVSETNGFDTPRLVQFDSASRLLLGDRAVFHTPGDVLYCQRPGDGALLWQTSLRAPETFDDRVDIRSGKAVEGARSAAVDGEIGVFNGNGGLYGVGLLTGRRLWFQPLTAASEPGREFIRDRRMAAANGIVAAVAEPGHLMAMRLVDGSLLWERDLRGEPVDTLRLVDGIIVTIDKTRQRVHLFDSVDGRHVARVAFRQPDPESRLTELVIAGGAVCGPDCDANGDAVIAVDVRTGAPRWRVALSKPLSQLFEPSENYLGIGHLGGDIQLVDATSGEPVTQRQVNVAQAVIDAIVVDTSLIVRANTTQTGERRPMLAAIEITSGEEIWRRTDLPSTAGMSIPLQVVDGAIPLVVEYQRVSASAAGLDPRCVGIAMVDAKTGENRFLAAELVAPRIQNRPNGDFEVWPDVMIVGTGSGVMAYRTSMGGGK